jgi:hypothetical protein
MAARSVSLLGVIAAASRAGAVSVVGRSEYKSMSGLRRRLVFGDLACPAKGATKRFCGKRVNIPVPARSPVYS